ncbi:ABC transporter substrate-binding protein [Mycolicibacterium cosmeticum]|uniref:Glutamine ABC transporter periplasmic protein n=1 Tax=Mycolicibacterium cosmeticum TaxID=258533 RepID=W9B010_MYCCO|nr:ABC transporter substrate-binding protein [Mycolicibacterium cosmeticum]TLH74150.1 ABC transporter substrate-binding protein [Mycolicibacterium cosmeticum]CDO11103.1 glutamine ABC transporter periplasmic protein [Mycolicibacterium cosmeticum]
MNRRSQPAHVATILGAALSAVLLSACGGGGGTSEASGKAPAGLLQAGQLSVCTDPEYPPMEYLENGDTANPTGFDSDGARALGKLWDVKVVFQNTSFDGLIPALNAKRCDITWSALYVSPERQLVADGIPFMTTGPGLIVRSGDESIRSADDLSGKTVAVQGGGANELTLKGLSDKFTAAGKPGITIQPYPKTAETVAAVTNGKADALIETDVAVVDMVGKSGGKLVSKPGIFPTETQFGVFTRKGSELTQPVTAGIKQLISDGTLPDLAKKYGLDPSRLVSP